jgi:hypothetical protein
MSLLPPHLRERLNDIWNDLSSLTGLCGGRIPKRYGALGMTDYRRDIDGLRAIAVLAVVGFHAFPSIVPGGYVGVDVFFVISGFLITGIIADKIDTGTFSFADFYARRIRRIFPALIVVLFATFAIGGAIFFADEFARLGWEMLSAATFSSNILFWHQAGYFDTESAAKPLLHLWSLAIEEQFYLLWPITMVLARKRIGATIFIVAVSTFAFSVWAAHHDPFGILFPLIPLLGIDDRSRVGDMATPHSRSLFNAAGRGSRLHNYYRGLSIQRNRGISRLAGAIAHARNGRADRCRPDKFRLRGAVVPAGRVDRRNQLPALPLALAAAFLFPSFPGKDAAGGPAPPGGRRVGRSGLADL